jgi:hypothetical protein
MPRAHGRELKMLTDTTIRSLKPRERRYDVTDRDGLQLEVHPSGKKVWRYRYRLHGKREKLTIGPYPAVSLRDARSRRLAAEELVQKEQSPALAKRQSQADRRLGTAIASVEDLSNSWIENVLRPANKRAFQDEVYVRRDLLPRIGALKPADVTAADVWACAEAVLKRGHAQAARRVRGVAKRVFDYAMSRGLIRSNPAASIKPVHIAPANTRSRTLNPAEIRQWLDAVYQSRLGRSQKLALHFLLLVPARKGELVFAKREHLTTTLNIGTYPKSTRRTGRRSGTCCHGKPRHSLANSWSCLNIQNGCCQARRALVASQSQRQP